jgi:endo-1,4-beta-mannosidase
MKLVSTSGVLFAAAALFALFPVSQSVAQAPPGFAYVSGTNFYVNGAPFHYGGDNTYWLGLKVMGTAPSEVDSEMSNYAAAGVKVVRTWAFSDGTADSLQPSLGVYNEAALRVLDYAVYSAGQHGIKLILVFTNNWTDFGGMTWYVQQVEGSNPVKNHFFTNATCQQYYKQYISTLVNRTNTYNGIQYKNDPAIFAWECANEARDEDDTTGNTIYNWYVSTSAYIRSLDANHMISTGEEGARKIAGSGPDYLNNGGMGSDFFRNVQIPNISFGTIHLYPGSWHKKNSWVQTYLADRASVAHSTAAKPIVLEEFGESTPSTTDFNTWLGYAEADDFNGIMPWQMVDTLIDRTFDFLFSSAVGTVIKNMCTYQNSR